MQTRCPKTTAEEASGTTIGEPARVLASPVFRLADGEEPRRLWK